MRRFLVVLSCICFLLMGAWGEGEDPIIGKWRWNTGNTIELNDENRLMFGDKDVGSWTLVQEGPPRRYRLDWKLSDGPYVDDLILTDKELNGTNNLGLPVSAEKIPRVWRNP